VSRVTFAELRPITEKAFLGQVRELARLRGWMCYTTYNSMHSPKGFLDLFMVRDDRAIAAELKSERGKLTPGQKEWIAALNKTCVEVYVFRPSDFERIIEVLR